MVVKQEIPLITISITYVQASQLVLCILTGRAEGIISKDDADEIMHSLFEKQLAVKDKLNGE